MTHPHYQLIVRFRSNEHPFSTTYTPRYGDLNDDAAAIDWARYMADNLGGDYDVSLAINGEVLPMEKIL